MKRKHEAHARSLTEVSNQRRAEAIDVAMAVAEEVYRLEKRSADPYAMHKAVESLPVEVLIEIVRAKTVDLFRKEAAYCDICFGRGVMVSLVDSRMVPCPGCNGSDKR